MLPYIIIYGTGLGFVVFELYAAFFRKAPLMESDLLVKKYTALLRYKKGISK